MDDWEKHHSGNRIVEGIAVVLLVVAVLYSCSNFGNPNCVQVGEDRYGSPIMDCRDLSD
jgi:hypothetical protein